MKPYPSVQYLCHVFRIGDDGVSLFWNNPKAKHLAGKPVSVTITEKGYARVMLDRRPLFLHRVLWKMRTGKDADAYIDHINQEKLDNRQENLRLSLGNGNWRNTKRCGGRSKFRGVYKAKGKNRWGARIKVNNHTKHLGTFDSEVEAARAYDVAAEKYHGEFCSTNKMMGLY